jgi:uncharacterized protein with ParB-like and HNH nuclease domain
MNKENKFDSKISIETLENLKEKDDLRKDFIIPIYQRKYAWKESEIEQLINDLSDFCKEHFKENDKYYFIGNIVVEELNTNRYSVIDGQQRLTTLYLMGLVSGENYFDLSYDVRENDKKFLELLANKKENIYESFIDTIAKEIKPDNQLVSNLKTIIKYKKDLNNLLKKVKFAFTILKKDEVDIAKYFEVMNSRGKQLEQHQILKAKFLECIDENEREIYAKLWDYCSRMDVYIEDFLAIYELKKYDSEKKQSKQTIGQEELRFKLFQFAFNKDEKIEITNFFKDNKSSDNSNKNGQRDKQNETTITILEALKSDKNDEEKEKIGVDEYRSFMKFEYFLLHILKLWCNKANNNCSNDEHIIFKDTKLIEQFESKLSWLKDKNSNSAYNAKSFLNTLFRYRILFDYFFFKRDKEKDEPFVAELKKDNNNISIERNPKEQKVRQILNLQLLFNFTTDFYAQHWIQSVFKWLDDNKFDNNDFDFYENYIQFLEDFDKRIMKERLEDKPNLQNIYLNYDYVPKEKITIDQSKLNVVLHEGTSTQHYWFYKLDYLLWRDCEWKKEKFKHPFEEKEKFKYENIPNSFRLSRLNSVEHIFPQDKQEAWKLNDENCEDCPKKGSDRIDCFGNLALISQQFNSSLSDDSENKKLKIQEQLNRGTIESLKMITFYSNIESSDELNLENCKKHQKEMIEILKNSIKQTEHQCHTNTKSH